MESEQRQVAKKQLMVLMQEGYRWQEAASRAGIRISRSTAYRWFQQFRTRGEAALHDGRHGHTAKMHKPVQEWLEARCRKAANSLKLLSSDRAERPLRGTGQHHPSQSHPCGTWPSKATRSGGKKITDKAQNLNSTGKMVLVDCCSSPLLMRPGCLSSWKARLPPV